MRISKHTVTHAPFRGSGHWIDEPDLPNEVNSVCVTYGSRKVYVYLNHEEDRLGVNVFDDGIKVLAYNEPTSDEE